MELTAYISENKTYIEGVLKRYVVGMKGPEQKVYEAMGYSLLSGGKRLRPMIILEVYKLYAQDKKRIEPFLAAMEMIHTYSLIHDDLPAMDNDDLRRGKPTCHIRFGEAMAILAGDGLLNMAFELMSETVLQQPEWTGAAGAMACLARKSGSRGMVGGQVVDMLSEDQEVDLETVMYIHLHKTSALLEAAFMMGAYLGEAGQEDIQILEMIGRNVGLAFQIQDDLLDIRSTEAKLGKPINSDRRNAKNTYVSLKGPMQAEKDVHHYLDEATALVKQLNTNNAQFIQSLIRYIRERDH